MTDAINRITAAAAQGLTRAEVIATVLDGRALTTAEQTAFDKARGILKLREAKRKADRRAAGPMSGAERVRRHRDGAIEISAKLADARAKIDWSRRRSAEASLSAWIAAYGIGVFIDDPPPAPHGEKILAEMDEAVSASRPYQILVARGGGKTSYTEACAAYAIATGRRRFCLISSINANQAQQILHELTAVFTSEPFATDYPEIALPISLLDGHGRRSQRYNGQDTKIRIVTGETLLPTIVDDGTPSTASGACIRAKALKSVRGTKNGTQRPDLIILDDLQTREIAENEQRVHDVLKLIRGDVMGLSGKGKASIISTATTIAADDVTEVLAADPAWKTTKNPAILAWPKEWSKPDHGLWGHYFARFDEENARDLKHTRRGGSLTFYRQNRAAMDAGADILNWGNYSRADGQISGLQKLLDKYHEMGEAAFLAEYQMEPPRRAFAFDVSARLVMSRVRNGVRPGALIPEHTFTAAATDINPSYALSTVIASFDLARSCLVSAYQVRPIHISDAANDTDFHRQIYNALAAHARELADMCARSGVTLDAWGIDAGGKQFDPVTLFARSCAAQHGLNAVAMTGRAGKNWNPNVGSKVRAALNETVRCRDPHGREWLAFDADYYKETAQRCWASDVGAPGGCSLFDGGADHTAFATQIANERLESKTPLPGGLRSAYKWRTKDPHDYGDCMAMLYALAGADGLNGDGCRTSVGRRVAVCL